MTDPLVTAINTLLSLRHIYTKEIIHAIHLPAPQLLTPFLTFYPVTLDCKAISVLIGEKQKLYRSLVTDWPFNLFFKFDHKVAQHCAFHDYRCSTLHVK